MNKQEILKKFTDKWHHSFHKIFANENMVFATNSKLMVVLPNDNEFEDNIEDSEKNIVSSLNCMNEANYNDFKTITLENIPETEKCKYCNGTGKAKVIQCPECDGSGEVEYEFDGFYSSSEIEGECPLCGGSGKVDLNDYTPQRGKLIIKTGQKVEEEYECNECDGTGKSYPRWRVAVTDNSKNKSYLDGWKIKHIQDNIPSEVKFSLKAQGYTGKDSLVDPVKFIFDGGYGYIMPYTKGD